MGAAPPARGSADQRMAAHEQRRSLPSPRWLRWGRRGVAPSGRHLRGHRPHPFPLLTPSRPATSAAPLALHLRLDALAGALEEPGPELGVQRRDAPVEAHGAAGGRGYPVRWRVGPSQRASCALLSLPLPPGATADTTSPASFLWATRRAGRLDASPYMGRARSIAVAARPDAPRSPPALLSGGRRGPTRPWTPERKARL